MAVQYLGYRKNPWVVTWKSATGCKLTRSFVTDREALEFERIQGEIAAQEKAVLRRRRAARAEPHSRITVNELLDSYFALAHSNPTTIKQSGYHAGHIRAAFGNRLASQLCK